MKNNIDNLKRLVSNFSISLNYYKSTVNNYNEHSCRIEYIDPFLEILGWDISNKGGVLPQFREVITENYSKETGRPDYSMTLSGVSKFFVEAKKPSVNIEEVIEPAYQTRSYGWSAKHKIAVLTNFEHLIIYDTTIPPKPGDDCRVAILKKYHYTEYIEKFEEIFSIISRDVVYSGEFDEKLDSSFNLVCEKGLQLEVDEYFLKQINEWRLQLGNYLYSQKNYSIDIINDVIQEFINQIIFLRICEDRNLPLYHNLREIISDESKIKNELTELFKNADKKYNSGLFSGDYIIFDLENSIIREIVEQLYYPQSPYSFSVVEPNLLGQIYELFLAEYLVLDKDKIVLTKKKEHINRDIVTTPVEIVRYMVQKGLENLCKNKAPNEILSLKIADIACGSGIFLIEVFDYLVKYCVKWYMDNNSGYLVTVNNGDKKLPFDDKRKILISCIFGIDIDVHAVEVSKFSLLMKLLEDETSPSVFNTNPILPNIDKNILAGNSLIDFDMMSKAKAEIEDFSNIFPFDWTIINDGNKFDLIIGNPPYVNTEDMNNLLPKKELKIYKSAYSTSYRQFDKYFTFLERAIDMTKSVGSVCYIVPNKFSKIKSGEKLRKLIADNKYMSEFIDFGSLQLFRNKLIYSSIILLKKDKQSTFKYSEVNDLAKWWSQSVKGQEISISSNILTEKPWILVPDKSKMQLISNLYTNSRPLGEVANVFNGIQTSAERPPVYWFAEDEIIEDTETCFKILKFGKEYLIEKNILKPYFKPVKLSEKKLSTYDIIFNNKWIIFPYDNLGKIYSIEDMKNRFPNTYKYLKDRYDLLEPKQLEGRIDGRDVPLATADTWYQYGRDQGLTAFNDTKKLIVGVLSKNPMYIYDSQNTVIASGGTAGYCAISEKRESPYKLEFIQAYLNHPIMEWILSVIGSDFEGGFYSRGTSVLQSIPVKLIDFEKEHHRNLYNNIVLWSKDIYSINEQLKVKPSKKIETALKYQKEKLVKDIHDAVSEIYSI